jgi:DNA-binding response OmpR family regulator
MRILVIEDNTDIAANLGDYLEDRGHIVDFAADGVTGLHLAVVNEFDAIVLDLNLPGMDGLEVCRKLRQDARRQTPVLMLTARDALEQKLAGFESGADDYLVKPFSLAELAARITALAQRQQLGQSHSIVVGPLAIDRQLRTATRAGQLLRLSPLLWDILLLLAEASPQPVARTEIARKLWGDEPPSSDALRSHIHLLRQIVDKPFGAPMIDTVHSIGFRLRGPQ